MSNSSWIHVDIDSYLQECPPWDQDIDPASIPALAKEVASRFDSTGIYDQLDKLACAVLREREARVTDTANP
jgi:hypothetical protein